MLISPVLSAAVGLVVVSFEVSSFFASSLEQPENTPTRPYAKANDKIFFILTSPLISLLYRPVITYN